MCLFRFTKAEQQASNQAAPPEHEGVKRRISIRSSVMPQLSLRPVKEILEPSSNFGSLSISIRN